MNHDAYAEIVARLFPGAKHVRHWALTGGVSAHIEAIEYELAEGEYQQVVVRRHGAADWKILEEDVTTTEFSLQTILFEAGFPVPEPLLLDVSGSVLPSPFLVMAMVQGVTVVDDVHLQNALHQMADFLQGLHNLDTETLSLPARLPRGEDPVNGALQYVPDTAANAALRAAIACWVTKPAENTLLHGDFWPGNILWKDNKIAAVIDWEDAAIGAAASDLAGCRCEIMAMYGEPAMETFTNRYLAGATREMSDLPLWEVYGGFAALGTMGDWGLDPEVEALRRERTILFVGRAVRELVDHA